MTDAASTATTPQADALARKEEVRRRSLRRRALTEKNKRMRELITPEGARLNLRIASAGERAGAFLIDFSIQMLTIFLGLWAIVLVAAELGYQGWNTRRCRRDVVYFHLAQFLFHRV